MIAAFCSNGEFICSLYYSTVDADIFWDFIRIIKYSLKMINIEIKSKAIIILDNASYHFCKQTIDFLKSNEIRTHFLPTYSPSLALVETLFKYLKSNIKKHSVLKSINFAKESGIESIQYAWSQISIEAREKAWIEFIKAGSQAISDTIVNY